MRASGSCRPTTLRGAAQHRHVADHHAVGRVRPSAKARTMVSGPMPQASPIVKQQRLCWACAIVMSRRGAALPR